MRFLKRLLPFILLLALCPQPVLAQDKPAAEKGKKQEGPSSGPIWQYDPKYRPGTAVSPDDNSLLSNSSFSIYFVRPADSKPDQAILRIAQTVAATGCMAISMPDPAPRVDGKNMRIKIGRPYVRIDDTKRYAHTDCPKGMNVAETEIGLSRIHLKKSGVQRIIFSNDFGMDTYRVSLTDNKLELIPQTSVLFTPNYSLKDKDPLVHWFYPEGTVILTAPGTPKGQNVGEELDILAAQKGLVPLISQIPEFVQPPGRSFNSGYFFDETGAIARRLQTDRATDFGAIDARETLYGPQGPYESVLHLAVVAKRPGMLE